MTSVPVRYVPAGTVGRFFQRGGGFSESRRFGVLITSADDCVQVYIQMRHAKAWPGLRIGHQTNA